MSTAAQIPDPHPPGDRSAHSRRDDGSLRSAPRPLSFGAEWRRQAGRPRTRWLIGILAVLPLIVVAAFALGDGGDRGGARFDDVATQGAPNFTVFMLFVTAELLLLIIGCLFVGDAVASEASWSSLRYLLVAPVPRGRLLTTKLLVGLAWTMLTLVGFLGYVLAVGAICYGLGEMVVPGAGVMEWSSFSWRLGAAALYVLISLLPFLAISFWVGVRVDAPLAAVGAGVLAAIVSSILDSLDALGDWRVVLPNHNARAWISFFGQEVPSWGELQHGVLWALLWATVLIALAYRHFTRKDVLS
ncbi:ABC transporter permease [Ornithinimicrobium sp. Y1694]|uniref:ABC transporter permease n=1 Tax=Ornithinimicrobium sp. Y1694 TaxID=3418590 RepID=UPI003CE68D2B